jgi:hypothetical protein
VKKDEKEPQNSINCLNLNKTRDETLKFMLNDYLNTFISWRNNFGGDSMLPFHNKCVFSGTHLNSLFQMVSKLIVAEVTCSFFLQN